MTQVRTRFAPSPTGFMHIGNLRTALYSFLIARKNKGKFILRIEDTDQERSFEEAKKVIIDSLNAAGIVYDEGPDKDGGYGPYIQSKRIEIYKKYINKLLDNNMVYMCFCDKKEIEKHKEKCRKFRIPYKYSGKCRSLSSEIIHENLRKNKKYVVRQRVPKEGTTIFYDHVYSKIAIENKNLDDQILLKSDGFPTYNFANVIDDHLMKITHVVRGCEYLSSTPKYNLLYKSFGWKIPEYIHLPHIVKESGKKLSKRDGDASFQDLLSRGYLIEAIVNCISLLGWNPGTEQEIFSMEDLIKQFDITKINKSDSVFSISKLNWINGVYIRKLDAELFHKKAVKYYPESIINKKTVVKLSGMLQKRINKFEEIPKMISFLDNVEEYSIELYNNEKMRSTIESSLIVLKEIIDILDSIEVWDNENIYISLTKYAKQKQIKNTTVLWPIRVALSGLINTPGGATEIAEISGKDITIKRIKNAIDFINTQILH